MNIDLNTDGPHSPDYTRQLGDALAETVRCLNYATLAEAPGLDYPADAYSLLGALCTAMGRMPQLLDQVGRFLRDQAATGALGDDHGRDPAIQAGMAADLLEDVRNRIAGLTPNLHQAQNDIAGLHVKGR